MNNLQLYGTASATASAVAQVTIPSKTSIKGILYAVDFTSIVASTRVELELSKIPTSQIAVNGAKDPFFHAAVSGNFVTSGLAQTAVGLFIPLDVPCRQGEIVYLHCLVAGTVTFYFHGLLYYP